MIADCKKAYVLLDQNDLKDFKDSYGVTIDNKSIWFPIDFVTMLQVMLAEYEGSYYIPKVTNNNKEAVIAKEIYAESQKFLKQLLLANNMVDAIEDSFPLEFFWFRLWSCVHRTFLFCDDFLAQHSVEKVVLIKRNKFVNTGGILINTASFTDLVEAVFKSKNIEVKILEHQKCYVKPKTIFYTQTHNLKTSFKFLTNFIYWKMISFNKKNYDHILIKPAYDNSISNYKAFKNSGSNVFPQIFHGNQIPFLHSWKRMIGFSLAKKFKKHDRPNVTYETLSPYKINFNNFKFDLAKIFQSTIVQYLKDVEWMSCYIDMLWDNCLDKGKRYLAIFSASPVHLDSYFVIKKTKEGGGKLAVWQHGGSYGYAYYFHHYITDYKNIDCFLSFGKNDIQEVTKGMCDKFPDCIEVGSKAIYGKSSLRNFGLKKSWYSHGLFIPAVNGTFYGQSSIKWRGDLQFGATKQIIDYFGSDEIGKIVVKGLKNHKPHHEIRRYIEIKGHRDVSYTDISIDRALSNNPKFIVIDNSSTPLLQVLAQYRGPIFLMTNQGWWKIRKDALALLKRRVVYSESVDELKSHLAGFLKNGSLNGIDTEDTSFVDVYLKRFCSWEYEHFLQKATQAC